MEAASHSTYQLSGIVLALRDDLNVTPRAAGGQRYWLIEDERNSRYYRVGPGEFAFLSLLDGRRTFAEALGRAASVSQAEALSEEAAAALCRWLIESGLATTEYSRSTGRVLQATARKQHRRSWSWLANPLSQRWPLLCPDGIAASLAALLGWVCSGPVLMLWLALVLSGALTLAQHWDRFAASTPEVIDRHNWFWLGVTTVLLKLLHESAHALACRRFGAPVREAGLVFVLFVPLPYVDVTSAWRCGSRWARVVIAAAGMGAELLMAALAVFVWCQSDSPLVQQHAANIIVSASCMTLLVNANPLLRFDGYFILSDLCDLPNLAQHGQQAWRGLGRQICLGLPRPAPAWPPQRTGIIYLYGLAALVWRIVVSVGLILAADALWLGAGVVLAAVAVLVWVVVPCARLVWFVAAGTPQEQPDRWRFVGTVAGVSLALAVIARTITWCPRIEAPAVVAYDPPVEVRAAVAGFVDAVLTTDGANVAAEAVLVRLVNPELEAQRAELRLQVAQARARADSRLQAGLPAAWEVEQEQQRALRLRLAQLDQQAAALAVLAPCAGRILDADLASLTGRYVRPGELLLTLGSETDRPVLALIEPTDREAFEQQREQTITVLVAGRPQTPVPARLLEVSPRAQRELPHAALGATAGGPLAVRAAAPSEPAPEARSELLEPRLLARLELPPGDRSRLFAGETGRVCLQGPAQSLAALCAAAVAEWWEQRRSALREQWYRSSGS